MWDWTRAATEELESGYTSVARVDILHSGIPVYTMAVIGGSTNTMADRPVYSNLECSLVDPTGQLTRGDIGELLNAYECEIAPWRGLRLTDTRTSVTPVSTPNAGFGLQPFGTSGFGGVEVDLSFSSTSVVRDEMAPLGVYGLTGRKLADTPDGLVVTLSGQDRAMGFQGPMASAITISAGTPVEKAIQRLLSTRQSGLSLFAMETGYTCGPLIFPPEIDVWAEAQKLAASVGAWLYHDRTGQATLSFIGAASDSPVARYAEGDGLLQTLDRAEDSDTIKNVVVAESGNGSVRVVVEDDDPTSPTYSRGRYGRRVYSLKNPYFGSAKQATVAAATRLAHELGRSETVNFTAVPNPGLDVNEVVTVHRPRAGLDERGLVVAGVVMPLAATELMQVSCRQSRLAQDGRVLRDLREVTM